MSVSIIVVIKLRKERNRKKKSQRIWKVPCFENFPKNSTLPLKLVHRYHTCPTCPKKISMINMRLL